MALHGLQQRHLPELTVWSAFKLYAFRASAFTVLDLSKSKEGNPLKMNITLICSIHGIQLLTIQSILGVCRSPLISFVYERGWRQGFAAAGFPGIASLHTSSMHPCNRLVDCASSGRFHDTSAHCCLPVPCIYCGNQRELSDSADGPFVMRSRCKHCTLTGCLQGRCLQWFSRAAAPACLQEPIESQRCYASLFCNGAAQRHSIHQVQFCASIPLMERAFWL